MAQVEIKPENLVYAKPRLITDDVMHYCPGCSHGTVHKLVAEVIDEMGLEKSTIAVSPVGCSVFAYKYVDVDWVEAAHGRACAVATAIKRLNPDRLVFTYQGQTLPESSTDNLASGIASVAFLAYLSGLTNVAYSATQYALFSSVMLILPKFLAGFSGMAVEAMGYSGFFTATACLGLPVLVLVLAAGAARRRLGIDAPKA